MTKSVKTIQEYIGNMLPIYEIQADIPAPPNAGRSGGNSTYPFGKMEIGDSFSAGNDLPSVRKIRAAASWYGRRNGKKFSCRMVEGGYRVWRIQ